MNTEDKEWGSLAEAAFLHGQGSIPAHLNKYSPDLHGTIFDTGSTQQRWLAEFGVSAGSSAHNLDGAGALGAQSTRNDVFASAGQFYGPLPAQASNVSGVAASQHTSAGRTQQQQHSDVWAGADLPANSTASHQVQEHHFHELAVSCEPTMQSLQQRQGAMQAADTQQQQQQQQQPPAAACTQQQQQQQQQQTQQQGLQRLQQQQQQQPSGIPQQQLWCLQQQLWGLQQQAALIAHQQQQLQQGGQVVNVLPQMTLPLALHLPLNVAGLAASGAAGFTPCTLQQPGLPNMAVAHTGLAGGGVGGSSHLSAAAAAAAAVAGPSAAAPNKRHRAVARHGSKASDLLPAAAAGAGAAAVMAAAAPTHPHLILGKATSVVKKQRERHRSVVSSLEAELAEKLAQLHMLAAENEMLKLRAAVLEATVQSREDQMRVISEHGPPVYPIDAPSPAPRSVPSTTATASSSATVDTESPTAAAAAAAGSTAVSGISQSKSVTKLPGDLQSSGSTAAGDLARVSEAAAAAGQDEEAAAAGGASGGAAVGAAGGAAAVPAAPESPPHLAELQDFQRDANGTRETIKQMCVEDIIRHWKQFLQDVTGELVHVQKEESLAAFRQQTSRLPGTCAGASSAASLPNDVVAAMLQQQQQPPALSPSHQRINQLVAKYSFLIKTAQQLNPSAYCRLFGTNLDTGLPAPYSDAHWRRVVKVLDLTKHQVNHILACAELYFSCRAKLQNEQRVLQQQLKHTSASTEGLLLASMTDDMSPMKPWLDQLANNLKREHVLRVMLNSFVWGKIFTPVQCAKAAVYSHPWYIDVHAIVCVMCEDALTTPAASGQRALVFPHRLQPGPTQQMVT